MIIALALLAPAWTVYPFTEAASHEWLQTLARAQIMAPTIEGVAGSIDPFAPISSPSCEAAVMKPDFEAQPLRDPRNKIECRFTQNGEAKTVSLSLADTEIDSWGNRFDNKPFTFKGPVVQSIFSHLRARFVAEPQNRMLSEILICDPNANICLESYFVGQAADRPEQNYYSPLQISCSRETEAVVRTESSAPTLRERIDDGLKDGTRKLVRIRCLVFDPRLNQLDN